MADDPVGDPSEAPPAPPAPPAPIAEDRGGRPFATVFGVVLGAPVDRPCQHCCHWTLPLAMQPKALAGGGAVAHAALSFEVWLIYHLHIQRHQGLGLPA
jgi:hypothetical protein